MTYAMFVLSSVLLGVAYFIIFFQPNVAEMFSLREPDKIWEIPAPAPALVMARTVAIGLACWISAFGVLGAAPSEFLYFQF